jgi:putative DNA methylase
MARAASSGPTKAQRVAKAVADAVGAGKAVQLETVDFNDPNRPKTCLEVDFPILPVNQVAAIEGNAGKPIYQMSKWWARRRSSVFRSLLLSASMKAPEDTSQAAKAVWDVYYANHQKKRSFANLKVADIFMGGGTTVVEGSRLGMQMFGNDLNPVAWFVVKTELADVKKAEVEALLADIEAEVKPQIMPFYACNGPHGERGTWTRIADGKVMGDDFDPLALKPEERKAFKYEGPEIIYVFWSKHGPCQVTGCGHRTPVMSSPVLAVKELSIKAWPHKCPKCKTSFDIEESEARMAPDVTLVVADGETPFAPINAKTGAVICPSCGEKELVNVGAAARATRRRSRSRCSCIHSGSRARSRRTRRASPTAAASTDDADTSARWYEARAKTLRLVEVRGKLPDEVTCPDTGVTFSTSTATIPKKANYACGACGTMQDVLTTVKASGKSGPVAPYAIQAYSPKRDRDGVAYGGATSSLPTIRAPPSRRSASGRPARTRPRRLLAAQRAALRVHDPPDQRRHPQPRLHALVDDVQPAPVARERSAPQGHQRGRRCQASLGSARVLLAAFQQYLRNQNMFCFWNPQRDTLEPHFSNNNFHPKATTVENCVFPVLGRGNWQTCGSSIEDARVVECPMGDREQRVPRNRIRLSGRLVSGKSEKVYPGDGVLDAVDIRAGPRRNWRESVQPQSTLSSPILRSAASPLLRARRLLLRLAALVLRSATRTVHRRVHAEDAGGRLEPARHPTTQTPTTSASSPRAGPRRTASSNPVALLAFTFHHSEDAPWVAVLESLFDAGFYLEATYPIRSDETKGDGEFGSQKIEYDIVHVCRKRTEEPTPVSWAKMRRQVLQDVRSLKHMLEHHQKAGLPEADLQVIRRGKALEYYSRHYGKVLVDDGRSMTVLEALVGINQLLDEETGGIKDPPPVNAEPFTRQFLRLFDGVKEIPRDQIQKFLRGTGIAPSDFEARGWCSEDKKIYQLTSPLEIARAWQGKHRRGMTSDYDQAAFLIGACFENSGINATDTLANDNFKPHPALGALLEWFSTRGATSEIRNASSRAQTILRSWRAKHESPKQQQMALFFEDQGAA